ncbi:MAG: hypothetical protein NTZ33_16180 [Bacteroidetes bacterium]|nr:hypothetical protein [Bacteroidota bacterium]
MKTFWTFIFICQSLALFGQYSFKGILLCKQDSTPVQFAIVKSLDIGSFVQTNFEGEFHFQIPPNLKVLHFEISAIGFHDTITYRLTHKTAEKIYVNKQPLSLSIFTVKGLSAVETVRKAVDMIPANYLDSSFASFSFFRQYQKVNGEFKNLAEAQTVILFRLSASKKGISVSNGFYVEQMRRNNFKFDINDYYYEQNSIADLLDQDPVYNLLSGALNPNAFYFYTFNFDTSNKTDDYVITYSCREFTNDEHGVSNIRDLGWNNEGREEGRFVIDRNSFAFKKIERNSYRNLDYHYPLHNNCLLPSMKYFCEFTDGKLYTEYEEINGKWALKKICQSFTNDYWGLTGLKEYSITDIYEWYSDSITHYIKSYLADKFYEKTSLPSCDYIYNKMKWNKSLPAFHYSTKNEVYHDLEKQFAIEEQFENNGKRKITPSNKKLKLE